MWTSQVATGRFPNQRGKGVIVKASDYVAMSGLSATETSRMIAPKPTSLLKTYNGQGWNATGRASRSSCVVKRMAVQNYFV